MKILLIVPNDDSILCKNKIGKMFPSLVATTPLVLQQLAALTPSGHEIDMVYERVGDKIDYNKYYDLVGISCTTYNASQAYEIADKFIDKEVPVVLGGYHPSALPKDAKPHADSVVIGEAEFIWPKLLKDVEEKALKEFYLQKDFIDPKQIPPARRDLDKNNYKKLPASLQTSRGCPNRCKFCSISNIIEGAKFRPRPVKNVVDEIKSIDNKYLFFSDASLTINPTYIKSLFKEMNGLNKKFLAYGNINKIGEDEELLKLASEAGCTAWYVGFESVSQTTIDGIGKKTNKVESYAKSVKKVHDYGMNVMGSFIFGFDTDTADIFDKAYSVINKYNIDAVDFNILVPFPGTPLYDQFEKEKRILTKDWKKYTGEHIVFKLKNMSEEELIDGINRVTKRYYSISNFLRKNINKKDLEFYSFFQSLWRYSGYKKAFKKSVIKNCCLFRI